MNPTKSGYADVNGIKLYHEIRGEGEPLVLIHGGLTTIGEMQGWVEPLAKTWQVIAVEMQGHGRTADTDRPMSFTTMGDDIAALLDHLKIPKADFVGHSFGGASAIRAAIQHPEKVRRLVVISSPYARSGWYPEAQGGMSQVGAAMAENMMQTPTGKFSKEWPEPQGFPQFLDKMGKMMSEDYDWSAGVRGQRLCVAEARCGVLRTLGRRREGAGLAEHATVRVAAGGCAWLQPLQFHNFGGGTAACRQVPGRSTHQCTNRRDTRLPGRPGPQQVLIGLLPPVRFHAPWRSRGYPAAIAHSKRATPSDLQASRTSHLALEA
jgi:pimeloyl-ACP methyl ester carboxylesterase